MPTSTHNRPPPLDPNRNPPFPNESPDAPPPPPPFFSFDPFTPLIITSLTLLTQSQTDLLALQATQISALEQRLKSPTFPLHRRPQSSSPHQSQYHSDPSNSPSQHKLPPSDPVLPPSLLPTTREANEETGLRIARLKYGPNAEVLLLREMVEKLRGELETLKWEKDDGRDKCQGRKEVNGLWEESLREAVRREREKDQWVIRDLRREIEELRLQTGGR